MSAYDIKRFVGDTVWNEYFKFCFERDPWDKAVSAYYWSLRKETEKRDIEQYMLERGFHGARSYRQYTLNGRVVVDRICRYENLREELAAVAEHLQLPAVPELPHAKSRTRTDKRHYSEFLSPAAIQAIAEDCAPEISLMGYRQETSNGDNLT